MSSGPPAVGRPAGSARSAAPPSCRWNLEWAAQWSLFGVTIEPNGKDLATAGGSRDRSDAIAREVFEREPPLNVPYEFLNIGGKKMSTSKGRGAAAHQIVEVVPPEQLRFLFLRPRPNHAIDFDPDGTDQIPRLFDEFDKFAAATAGREVKGEIAPGFDATFRYSLLDPAADVAAEAAAFRVAFNRAVMFAQSRRVDPAARATAEKGEALSDRETALLHERLGAASAWLETYAPESARFEVVRDRLPASLDGLDEDGRRYLGALADAAERERPASGDAWQNLIFEVATSTGLAGRAAFAAIYTAFLDRPNGPRAGWLLAGRGSGVRRRAPPGGRGMSVGLQRLREEADVIRDGAVRKGEDPALVDRALELDAERRRLLGESETLKAERNAASKRIGEAIRAGAAPDGPEVAGLRDASTAAGERITALDASLAETEATLDDLLLRIPNPPDLDIPVGGEEANVTIRTWGEILPHEAAVTGEVGADAPPDGATWIRRPHWELGEALDILDNARGAKIAGSGFPVYKGAGSALQRGLINWFLDVHTREHGFTEVWPPAVVNADSARGTGQIPDKEDQMYVVTRDDLYLVPTAEVPVTNLHRDEIFDAADAADPLRRLLPMLPSRGRRGRQGHPRHPARPPVRQGRDGPVRAPGGQCRRPRVDDRARRGPAPAARPGLSRPAHEHPRDGLHPGPQVRPGGLVARRRALAGGQLVLELPRLPGAADGHPLPTRARRQAGAGPHAQWIGPRARPDRGRDPGDVPAGRRLDHRP